MLEFLILPTLHVGPRLIPSLQKKMDSMQSTEFTVHHNVYVIESSICFYILRIPWKHDNTLTDSNNNLMLMRQLNDAVLIINISIFPLAGYLEPTAPDRLLCGFVKIIVGFRVGKKCSESLLGLEDPQSRGNSLQRKCFSSKQQVQPKLGRIHRKWDGVPFMLRFYFCLLLKC